MNPPSPAIIAQNAVRPLPRWIMLLLCVAYVLAGFVGREPWREVDMAAFGYMQAMARGETAWLHPLIDGIAPQAPGLLQYWLGAWALKLLPSAIPTDVATRLPFIAILALTLWSTWRAIFSLARTPGAQPVAFAFGGEATPTDYARAMADGGLLALLACLGLAQFTHETSHTLVQLCAVSLVFFAGACMWWQPKLSAATAFLGTLALTLSGGLTITLLLGVGIIAMVLTIKSPKLLHRYSWAAWWTLSMVVASTVATFLGLWEPRFINPWLQGKDWQSTLRLLIWFSWPAWPLAFWALWRWRWQLQHPKSNPHLTWPLWLWLAALICTIFTEEGDRALILALPGIATLATFALPTLKRTLSALIDWLTLFFFTISAVTIWVVWVSVQTGFPAKPAANVQRLADGFEPTFTLFPFLIAVTATIGWCLLIVWRTRRHRAAIWKSLAVPAGGTVLGWVLLMTLWLPMLNFGRSYEPHIQAISKHMPEQPHCINTLGLNTAQITALRHHMNWVVHPLSDEFNKTHCNWMISTPAAWSALSQEATNQWQLLASVERPTERRDILLLLRQP